jgi:predicted MPP superfamily phosphohydrolase
MMKKRWILVLLTSAALGLFLPGCQAQPPTGISGRVFVDATGSGMWAAGDQPLAGVPVSDGRDIALTDAQGRYALPAATLPGLVRVTVPTGYWPTGEGYFHRVETAAPTADFPLHERAEPTPWRFVHVSDVHYFRPARLLARKWVDEVNGLQPPPALVINTGDLVNDSNALTTDDQIRQVFADYQEVMTGLPAPLLNVCGNHDLPGYGGKLSPDDPLWGVRGYEALIGPAWYSLDYAGVHLVVIFVTRRDPVSGRITEDITDDCRAWLEKDLAITPKDRPLLLFSHQPPELWQHKVESLLVGRKLLGVFCGHRHEDRVYQFGDWTVYDDGALSGSWWLGPGPTGTPRGYSLVTVTADGVQREYRKAP